MDTHCVYPATSTNAVVVGTKLTLTLVPLRGAEDIAFGSGRSMTSTSALRCALPRAACGLWRKTIL